MRHTHIIAFALGLTAGIFTGILISKRKYEKIAEEEVESIKLHFKPQVDDAYQNVQDSRQAVKARYSPNPPIEELLAQRELDKANKEANQIIAEQGYSSEHNYFSDSATTPKWCHIIEEETFGELDEYETAFLTLYSDGVLADENDHMTLPSNLLIPSDIFQIFKEDESEDLLYVRNSSYKTDMQIEKDNRTYIDILEEKPYLKEYILGDDEDESED